MKNKTNFETWLNEYHEPFLYIRNGLLWLNIILAFLFILWALLNITPELNNIFLFYLGFLTILRILSIQVYLRWVLIKKYEDELKN